MSDEKPITIHQAMKRGWTWAEWWMQKPSGYTIITYPAGYQVLENGDIVTLDGQPVPQDRYISAEHLRIAAERKAKR